MADEMKKLLGLLMLKISGRDKTMVNRVNHVLPTEVLKKILEKLDFKSLGLARQTCKCWKEIIDVFELVKQAYRKSIVSCTHTYSTKLFFLSIFFHFLGRISCIIIAGGLSDTEFRSFKVQILIGDIRTKILPKVTIDIFGSSVVVHNGKILLCGGYDNDKACLQLDRGTWKEYNALNEKRFEHSSVTTQTASFLFGGLDSETTYEYLPKDSTTWLMGKTEIPGGFLCGAAISVKSEQEIWLIGGESTGKRILSFSVKDHTFQELPFTLKQDKPGAKCSFLPNTNKIMIMSENSKTTELLDTEKGSLITLTATPNSSRKFFGLGVITTFDKDRLALFGGRGGLDSVELYNTQTEKWDATDIKLQEPKAGFSVLTAKLGDIFSNIE